MLARICCFVAGIVTLAALSANAWIEVRARTLTDFEIGTRLPLPSGRDLDGRTVGDEVTGRCLLVRFGSKDCAYCRKDVKQLASIERVAGDHGCRIVSLAPTPTLYPDETPSSAVRLAYPDVSFLREVQFRFSPTTLVLNREGVVIWSREGALQNHDSSNVARALGRLRDIAMAAKAP